MKRVNYFVLQHWLKFKNCKQKTYVFLKNKRNLIKPRKKSCTKIVIFRVMDNIFWFYSSSSVKEDIFYLLHNPIIQQGATSGILFFGEVVGVTFSLS